MPANHRVILDTDIGDDIDDAFALALLLRSPEVALNEITTVFGDVVARAWTAQAMTAAAGYPFLPVNDGCAGTISVRGTESGPLKYGGEKRRKSRTEAHPEHAIRTLVGDTPDVLITIGPLTNVALTLACRPNALFRTRLITMAGEFQNTERIEHNVRCDPEAAHRVFSCGRPIDFIPWSIGAATKLDEADVRRLESSSERLVKLLVDYLHQFWRHVPGKTNMYDPMTVVALLRPELFDWRRGRVTVELRDETLYGLTRFEPDEAGPHRVAFGVQASEAKAFMLDRLLAGGA